MADEDNGGTTINGIIMGASKRTTAYRVDGINSVFFVREDAKDAERQIKLREAIFTALNLNSGMKYTVSDILNMIVDHEAKVRIVMASAKLRKFQFKNRKEAVAA